MNELEKVQDRHDKIQTVTHHIDVWSAYSHDVGLLLSLVEHFKDGLLEYGSHKIGCPAPHEDDHTGELPCTCGFSDALKTGSEPGSNVKKED